MDSTLTNVEYDLSSTFQTHLVDPLTKLHLCMHVRQLYILPQKWIQLFPKALTSNKQVLLQE